MNIMSMYNIVMYTVTAVSLVKNLKSSYDAIVWAKETMRSVKNVFSISVGPSPQIKKKSEEWEIIEGENDSDSGKKSYKRM